MLKDKNILLGVSGGIAAYKAIDLCSRLIKAGAKVRTILTENAKQFVAPLNFSTISHEKAVYDTFNEQDPLDHINLADWADLFIVAPATANIIGKFANGIADDLLSTTNLAITCPTLILPAMNVNMFRKKSVQRNLQILQSDGYHILEPEKGQLACGYEGKGRYPKNEEVVYFADFLLNYNQNLSGKRILITAGANREDIDPMRFISNKSSGKMGLALARSAYFRGAEVTLIHAQIQENIPHYINSISAISAEEMHSKVMENQNNFDIIIMAAAVADYTIAERSEQKIKKKENLQLNLSRTKDILSELGENKGNKILVGFAAESENVIENAKSKLQRKNLDFIIANNLQVAGKNETAVYMISSEKQIKFSGTKFEVANYILDSLC